MIHVLRKHECSWKMNVVPFCLTLWSLVGLTDLVFWSITIFLKNLIPNRQQKLPTPLYQQLQSLFTNIDCFLLHKIQLYRKRYYEQKLQTHPDLASSSPQKSVPGNHMMCTIIYHHDQWGRAQAKVWLLATHTHTPSHTIIIVTTHHLLAPPLVSILQNWPHLAVCIKSICVFYYPLLWVNGVESFEVGRALLQVCNWIQWLRTC